MAFGRKALVASAGDDVRTKPPQRMKSLVASAIRTNITDLSYNLWKFRDETWQREMWRFYDIIPEFGFAAQWIGQCCSKVRIYVAKVDELGRVQEEVKDPKINALADTLLGGPSAKAEKLLLMGVNLTVAGECYIVGRPGEDTPNGRDEWYILSSSEMRRVQGGNGQMQWAWTLPNGEPFTLDLERNVITRVWSQHPQRVWCAYAPSQRCQMVLRELEQLTKYVFSQIDSRLIGAGLLVIPNNLDLPPEEGANNAGESLMIRLATAGAASLRGEGTALGVLPNIVESDNAEGWKYLTFESLLSKDAMELRKEAVMRLGVGMDMPAEVLTGLGSENHWNAFLIDGYGIKVHIEPLMNRICDALTSAYLVPALKLMGKDPSRYVYAYDTSPLTLRPQRLQDALNLYDKGALSAEALRAAGYFKETDAPSEDEDTKRVIRDILLRDPQLLQNQAIREAAQIPERLIPQSSMIAPTPESIAMGPGGPGDVNALNPSGGSSGAPPPPPPPNGIQTTLPPPMPDINDSQSSLFTPPPTGIQASAFQLEQMGITVAAEATVRRAMELAGKRLLDRDARTHFADVPPQELHTRIKVEDRARVNRLLAGAWDQLEPLVQVFAPEFATEPLQRSLEKYCAKLLLGQKIHDPESLFEHLRADGVFSGQ